MRDRVALEQRTSSTDSHGAPLETWTRKREVWAAVQPRSGREFYAQDQTRANVTHMVEIRHDAQVDPSWRIKWGTRVLAITAAVPDPKGTRLSCLCIEQVV